MEKRVRQQKEHYDKSAYRPYEDLGSGQKVVYDHFSSTRKRPHWRKGTIDKKAVTPRSFYIDTPNRKIRRNRKHIKAEKGDGVDLDLLPQSTSHGEDCPPTSFSENDDEETTGQFDTIAGEPSLSDISVPETDNDLQSRATCERPRRTIKLPTKFQDYVMSVRE